MSVGRIASFMSTAKAPVMPMSSAVTASFDFEAATTIFPSRSRMSARSLDKAKIAMISLATVISNPVSLIRPFSDGPWPTVIFRNMRSLTSTTRRHVMVSGSISSLENRLLSSSLKASGLRSEMPSFSRRLI